ncbi:MAG: putative Ig domain-containing protein, partial [Candidatus Omnitrophica bacterium]|nr:putative Ig domain-containing protein [Candidatus Omnitrophota bacterium]
MRKFLGIMIFSMVMMLPGYAAALDATVDSLSANPGDTITINIDFSNNVDDVFAVDTTLNWDPAVLQANSVANGAEFAAFSKIDNLTVPGEARISQFGFTAVNAPSGRVLSINFTVLATAPAGASTLTLNRLDFGTDTVIVPVNGTPTGTVTVLSSNQPPVLNPIGDKSAQIGVQLQFTVSATDPDLDALNYSATPLPTGANFNAGTQTFTWTPVAGQEGPYDVTFGVDDTNGGTDSETITITVSAAPNNPPVLDPIGNKSVQVGNTLSFTLTATDLDPGATLTYSANPLPTGASLNTITGDFSWTPVIGQDNTYNVTFSVSDGNGGQDTELVQILVTPLAGVHNGVVGSTSASPGDSFNLPITFNSNSADVFAVDTILNWDPAVLQANSVSNGSTFSGFSVVPNLTVAGQATVSQFGVSPISVSSGEVLVVNFTVLGSAPAGTSAITLNKLDFGTDTITIPVGSVTNGSVTVTVATNNPPVLDPIGNKSVQVGNTLNFTVTATDPDVGDILTFGASPLPSGASLNPSTGAFNWTPTAGQVGTTPPITFTVNDGNGGTDSEVITITVTAAPNTPPVLTPIGPKSVAVNGNLNFTVSATDPDPDILTYSAAPLPTGATFNPATRVFNWTPTAPQAGTHSITFTVNDGNGGIDTELVVITVVAATGNAQILTPTSGSTLNSTPVTITWSPGTNVSQYWLTIGTVSGGTDIYTGNAATN